MRCRDKVSSKQLSAANETVWLCAHGLVSGLEPYKSFYLTLRFYVVVLVLSTCAYSYIHSYNCSVSVVAIYEPSDQQFRPCLLRFSTYLLLIFTFISAHHGRAREQKPASLGGGSRFPRLVISHHFPSHLCEVSGIGPSLQTCIIDTGTGLS